MALALFFMLVLTVTSSWAQTTTPKPTHKPRPTKPPGPDLVTALQDMGNFTTLISLVTKAGLANQLLAASELTLFAPTDEAFARLPASTIQTLESDANLLKSILTYHAVGKTFEIRGKFQDTTLASMNMAKPIRLNIYGNLHTISAEGVNITTKNVRTMNGYIHVIDGVLTPPEGNIVDIIDSYSTMTKLKSLLSSAGLRDVIKNDMNVTVFVPNDDAFAAVDDKVMNYLLTHPTELNEVVLYHVVARMTLYSIGMKHTLTFPTSDHHHDRIMVIEDDSNNVYINDAKIVDRDLSAVNGVIHVIDKVLIPAKILLKIEDSGLVVG